MGTYINTAYQPVNYYNQYYQTNQPNNLALNNNYNSQSIFQGQINNAGSIYAMSPQAPQQSINGTDDNSKSLMNLLLSLFPKKQNQNPKVTEKPANVDKKPAEAVKTQMTPSEAATILKDKFDSIKKLGTGQEKSNDDLIDMADLQAIVLKKDLDQDLRDAAQYFIDNKTMFNSLESTTDGKTDGNAAISDLDGFIEANRTPAEKAKAKEAEKKDEKSNKEIIKEDLRAIKKGAEPWRW